MSWLNVQQKGCVLICLNGKVEKDKTERFHTTRQAANSDKIIDEKVRDI